MILDQIRWLSDRGEGRGREYQIAIGEDGKPRSSKSQVQRAPLCRGRRRASVGPAVEMLRDWPVSEEAAIGFSYGERERERDDDDIV
ncbi:hypothetical protein M0R45_007135 [Rubus argutus]|uniref:Uncharacterized protein n=1 Tax=Rubus argutus TaxID=59490 RepID=A0AAW1YSN7_RUBAR